MTETELFRLGYSEAFRYLEAFNLDSVVIVKFFMDIDGGTHYVGRYYDGFREAVTFMQESGVQNRQLTTRQMTQSWREMDKWF